MEEGTGGTLSGQSLVAAHLPACSSLSGPVLLLSLSFSSLSFPIPRLCAVCRPSVLTVKPLEPVPPVLSPRW